MTRRRSHLGYDGTYREPATIGRLAATFLSGGLTTATPL